MNTNLIKSNGFFYILILFLFSSQAIAQREYFRESKKNLKKGNLYVAVFNATKVLDNSQSTKNMLKVAQEIIADNIENAIAEQNSKIDSTQSLLKTFDKHKSVDQSAFIVSLYDNLANLYSSINNIPESRKEPSKKKGASIILPNINYQNLLNQAKLKDNQIKSKAALEFMSEAKSLMKENSLDKLKKSYIYFKQAASLDKSLDNEAKSLLEPLGNKIANLLIKPVNKLLASNNLKKVEDAFNLANEAKLYSSKQVISNIFSSTKTKLQDAYYDFVLETLLLNDYNTKELEEIEKKEYNSFPRDASGNPKISRMKISFDKEKAIEELEKIDDPAEKAKLKAVYDKLSGNKENNNQPTHITLDQFRASYLASIYIEKLIAMDSEFRDLKIISDIARNRRIFIDPRDNNKYYTSKMGDLIWMSTNLKFKTNGAIHRTDCKKDGSKEVRKELGYYYNWYSVMNNNLDNNQGICPKGWRLPNNEEWQKAIDIIKADPKESGRINPDTGGYIRKDSGTNSDCQDLRFKNGAYFWSSSYSSNESANLIGVSYISIRKLYGKVPISSNNPMIQNAKLQKFPTNGSEPAANYQMNCRCIMDLPKF
ncbi:FISUMP domain-containing protein [uncultured Algibacter sp.]|uniref:FISUMP domain-containing protein n=1 Tax=uncultured Algibacter sp. TaxID=298659 RepID=UPI002611FF37|nr:FISUMP domain-containing protein [uncultured Algibacter sp.]